MLADCTVGLNVSHAHKMHCLGSPPLAPAAGGGGGVLAGTLLARDGFVGVAGAGTAGATDCLRSAIPAGLGGTEGGVDAECS